MKLKDRIDSYINGSEYKLLPKVPLVIEVNGRGFSKATSLLDKPYCPKFAECMNSVLLRLCNEIEGVLFGYGFNDELVFITRNDQNLETEPWLDNKINKICSIVSGIASLHFHECAKLVELNLLGSPGFIVRPYVVPTISEAINCLIYKQQFNFYKSLQLACFYEFLKKERPVDLTGLSLDEKRNLLLQEGINFNSYPLPFRRGVGCYKTPKIINEVMKNKWIINEEMPIFTANQVFLSNIMKMGADIFRHSSV